MLVDNVLSLSNVAEDLRIENVFFERGDVVFDDQTREAFFGQPDGGSAAFFAPYKCRHG